MLILYIKIFYLTQSLFFSEFKRNKNIFGPLKSLRESRHCPSPSILLVPWFSLKAPHSPQVSLALWPHSLLFLTVVFQFSKWVTQHTPVTCKIKKEKFLFLLCDVREFSNI